MPISRNQSISPGAVATEFFFEEQIEAFKKVNVPLLNAKDISDAVLYVLGTPPHVQVKIFSIKNNSILFDTLLYDIFSHCFQVLELTIKPLGEGW